MKLSKTMFVLGILLISILTLLLGTSFISGYGNFGALTTGVVVERDRNKFWRDLIDSFDWEKFDWENFPWEKFEDFPWEELPWDKVPTDFDLDRLPWDMIPDEFPDFPYDKVPQDLLDQVPWDDIVEKLPDTFDWGNFDFDKLPDGFDFGQLPWDNLPEDFDYGKLPWDKMTEEDLANVPWDKVPPDRVPWDKVPLDKLPENFDYNTVPWDSLTPEDLAKVPWDKLPEDFDYGKLPWDKMTPEDVAKVPFDKFTESDWRALPEDFPWWLAVGGLIVAGSMPPETIPYGIIPQSSLPQGLTPDLIPAEWRSKFQSVAPPHRHRWRTAKILAQATCGTPGLVLQECSYEGCTLTRQTVLLPTNAHSYDENRFCPVCGKYCLSIETGSYEKAYDGTPLVVTDPEYRLLPGTAESALRPGVRVELTGTVEIVNPGTQANAYDVKVYDAGGNDITDEFYLDAHFGTVTIRQRKIKITTRSLTVKKEELDGKPLTGDMAGYDVGGEDGLLPGHTIEVEFDKEGFTSGMHENIPVGYKIYDEDRVDVTAYYEIEEEYGFLRIR